MKIKYWYQLFNKNQYKQQDELNCQPFHHLHSFLFCVSSEEIGCIRITNIHEIEV